MFCWNIKPRSNNQTQPLRTASEIVERAWTSMGHFLYHLDPDIRLELLHLKILKRKYTVVFNITYLNDVYILFIIQRVKVHAIPCPHQPSTRDDNTVSIAQGGTATLGATKQLLPPDRVFKRIIYIYIYIYRERERVCKVKLATLVEGDQKAPFSIATKPKCKGGHYSFPWIAPLYLSYVPYIAEC